MPFLKKYQEIISKTQIPLEKELLKRVLFFSLPVFLLTFGYLFLRKGAVDTRVINQSLAWVSVILMGLSFALSGICYFWNFADKYIIYRKHLGLVGFWYAVGHVVLTLYNLSRRYDLVQFFLAKERFNYFIYGVLALFIFSIMASISNKFAVHELGGKTWRRILRFGYVAFAAATAHFIFIGFPQWQKWMVGFKGLPPLGLAIIIFAIFVFVLRIALEISLHLRKKQMEQETSTPATV